MEGLNVDVRMLLKWTFKRSQPDDRQALGLRYQQISVFILYNCKQQPGDSSKRERNM